MKVIIVGGVAGGELQPRLRRNDESAEIIIMERGQYISYANCGLPLLCRRVITDKGSAAAGSRAVSSERFGVDVRTESEFCL